MVVSSVPEVVYVPVSVVVGCCCVIEQAQSGLPFRHDPATMPAAGSTIARKWASRSAQPRVTRHGAGTTIVTVAENVLVAEDVASALNVLATRAQSDVASTTAMDLPEGHSLPRSAM